MADVAHSESTATLLSLLRQGDESARERLMARYLPMLRRWAHGRLPTRARDLNDTNDLVQITLLSALKKLDEFRSQHEGALLAYLRTTLMNAIRGEIRRVGRAGQVESITEDDDARGVDSMVPRLDSDQWLDYERALAKLPEPKREAVLLRLEFGMSYAEIAAALGRPSEAAASMMVSRALIELAQHLE
ncbi:RNA polymerase sigma factor [Dokdonella immobilis]|uniref:RNA polymerase sigma-70 factor, ECF subfamily n=1 Tax=Dokdonella immobilis TaxID=578942 RepID=A0A1I4Y711_9GAMM|nr:sigma-70 family RNA polymerase sigma factor [Dokdonella immobilis]SFN33856.1 RNA polymerase sigma-70 factor, ECF subfamily [Dokdonella immobilis]